MSPAGNFECLYAAIQGGADSVYFGVGNLNMRAHSANNFTPDDLPRIVEVCREYGVKTYMTLKIVLYSEDLATFGEDSVYDQADSAGFIHLFGLPITVQAKLKEKLAAEKE